MMPFEALRMRSPQPASLYPSTLFTGGEIGDYWRFNNVYCDVSTVGASISTVMGAVNGRTLTQAAAGFKPKLQQDAGGRWYAQFDGVDDQLIHALGSSVSMPGTIIMTLRDPTTATHIILTGGSASLRWQFSIAASGMRIAAASTLVLSGSGSPLGGADGLADQITGIFNGESSQVRANKGALSTTGTVGTQATNQITIGKLYDGTLPGGFKLYDLLFINRLLTTTELNDMEVYSGAQGGLTL